MYEARASPTSTGTLTRPPPAPTRQRRQRGTPFQRVVAGVVVTHELPAGAEFGTPYRTQTPWTEQVPIRHAAGHAHQASTPRAPGRAEGLPSSVRDSAGQPRPPAVGLAGCSDRSYARAVRRDPRTVPDPVGADRAESIRTP